MPKANKGNASADDTPPDAQEEVQADGEAPAVGTPIENRDELISCLFGILNVLIPEVGGFSTRFAAEVAAIKELAEGCYPPDTTDVPDEPAQES